MVVDYNNMAQPCYCLHCHKLLDYIHGRYVTFCCWFVVHTLSVAIYQPLPSVCGGFSNTTHTAVPLP